jgi:hypothetical protein
MFTDLGLRLATAESISGINSGASAIMANSVTAALDQLAITTALRNAMDISGGEALNLALNVTTAFTSGTFGATVEFQLISIPILPTLLTSVTGGRASVSIASVVTDIADASPDLADTFVVVGHGLPLGTPIFLTSLATTTGIANNTVYYVIPTANADRFKVATTLANALAGTAIDLLTGDGTATVNFIPTVHASTGTQQILGTPTTAGILGVIGNRMVTPLMPMCGPMAATRQALGQTIRTQIGTAQQGQLASNAQRFYVMRFLASNAITAGAVTIDLVTEAGASGKYFASGFEVF